jgi:hypothetical protein
MSSTDTIQQSEEREPAAMPVGPRLKHLERRLVEAFDQLWNSFVDPAEPMYDADGTAWNARGGQRAVPQRTGVGRHPQRVSRPGRRK